MKKFCLILVVIFGLANKSNCMQSANIPEGDFKELHKKAAQNKRCLCPECENGFTEGLTNFYTALKAQQDLVEFLKNNNPPATLGCLYWRHSKIDDIYKLLTAAKASRDEISNAICLGQMLQVVQLGWPVYAQKFIEERNNKK